MASQGLPWVLAISSHTCLPFPVLSTMFHCTWFFKKCISNLLSFSPDRVFAADVPSAQHALHPKDGFFSFRSCLKCLLLRVAPWPCLLNWFPAHLPHLQLFITPFLVLHICSHYPQLLYLKFMHLLVFCFFLSECKRHESRLICSGSAVLLCLHWFQADIRPSVNLEWVSGWRNKQGSVGMVKSSRPPSTEGTEKNSRGMAEDPGRSNATVDKEREF